MLKEKYDGCLAGLKWWCGEKGKYGISKVLRDFMSHNPPEFQISHKCCDGAKKRAAKSFYNQVDCCLAITGERRAEGGVRATRHNSCFNVAANGLSHYRPLYFWTDADKKQYKDYYGLKYSDCYEVYGMRRTGCAGCPFNSAFEDTLHIIHEFEPKLEKAVNNIFGESYEYTRKYREFKKNRKEAGSCK